MQPLAMNISRAWAIACPLLRFTDACTTWLAALCFTGRPASGMAGLLHSLAEPAGASKDLSCSFVSSGLLHKAAECAQELTAAGGDAATEQVRGQRTSAEAAWECTCAFEGGMCSWRLVTCG